MNDILSVVGARPQFIKAAPVSRALRERGLHERIVHTGQHYDREMSRMIIEEIGLSEPAVNLGVGSGSHAAQTAAILTGLEAVLEADRPDVVLVYGDTNSTIAAALAASKLTIPVAHVEAGLRSFNRRMPEEINRVVTDRLSDLLFCPTGTAVGQLEREGMTAGVHLTGDVMLDATLMFADRARELHPVSSILDEDLPEFALATVHRPENTDDMARLGSILSALGRLGLPVVLPLHPRTRTRLVGVDVPAAVHPIEPVSYVAMLSLIQAAEKVLTDSGGLQKEAVWLGTPCVTLRDETEWPETLEGEWNRLAGADEDRILEAFGHHPAGPPPVFGRVNDRDASRIVADILAESRIFITTCVVAVPDAPEIIHLASTHSAFDSRIFRKECVALARHGYSVSLIVPHDRDEVVEGIRIRAVPVPASGRERILKTLSLIYRAALQESEDAVFHFHDSELIFHMLELKRRGRRVVYDAHEIPRLQVYHQVWIPTLLRPLAARLMHFAENAGDRYFDGVVAAVPAILEQFSNPERILVRNFPFTEAYHSAESTRYEDRPNTVFYLGGITKARGLRQMVQAVSLLPDRLGARLRLAGSFYPAELRESVPSMVGGDRTQPLGYLDRDGLVRELDRSRIGIVVLQPTPQYRVSYPTKLFQYMAAGIPVVASDFDVWRRLVEPYDCALFVDPTDPREIAQALRWLLENPVEARKMGERGLAAARAEFDWSGEARELIRFYERLLPLASSGDG